MRILSDNILLKHKMIGTTSLIQLTDDSSTLEPYADVVAVGETVRGVAEGDKVFFNTNSGRFIEIDGQELIMVTIHEIFIVFDE